jgi:hypothetical protein
MKNKLGGYQGYWLENGARTIFLNSCLSMVVLYMISSYRVHACARKKFGMFRGRMLWQEDQGNKKYHLTNSVTVCSPNWLKGDLENRIKGLHNQYTV